MVDVTVTAANVAIGSGAQTVTLQAGAAINAGQLVYYDTTTGTAKLADADALASAALSGMAISESAGATGQFITVVTRGYVTMNAGLTAGVTYYVSTTAGGVAPFADLGSGDYITVVGTAVSTTSLYVNPFASGVAV